MHVPAEHQVLVRDAIARVEAVTSGDFVCVLMRRASSHSFYPLAWATVLALALPWLLLWATPWPFADILVVQSAAFAMLYALLSFAPVRRHLVPRRVQRAAAHRAATEQFFIRGLAATPKRRGVLVFVAHEEHYARILADEGAAAVIPDEQWKEAIDLLVAEARDGRHAHGFVAALDRCAAVMASVLPPEGGRRNALADRFYVLD